MKTPHPPAALEAHLGYWLRTVSNHVSRGFAEKLAGRDTSVAEWVVLRLLFEHEAPPSQLATHLGLTRGAITKLVDRLAARDLVVRAADGPDRRYQAVRLTHAGRALVPELAALADQNEAEHFAALDRADRAALERILRTLAHHQGLTTPPTD